jgi:hypothetical protein
LDLLEVQRISRMSTFLDAARSGGARVSATPSLPIIMAIATYFIVSLATTINAMEPMGIGRAPTIVAMTSVALSSNVVGAKRQLVMTRLVSLLTIYYICLFWEEHGIDDVYTYGMCHSDDIGGLSDLEVNGSGDDDTLILDLRSLPSTNHSTQSMQLQTTSTPLYIRYNGSSQATSEGDAIRIIANAGDGASVVYQPSKHTFGDGRLLIHTGTGSGDINVVNIIVDFVGLEPVSIVT